MNTILQKLHIETGAVYLMALVAICILGYVSFKEKPQIYARGTYGTICYLRSSVPETVTKPIYYKTEEGCLRSIDVVK